MKISELTTKSFLVNDDETGANSYMLINAPETVASEEDQNVTYTETVTHKVTLQEFGKMLVNTQKLVRYDTTNGNILNTYDKGTSSYTDALVGQFITATDRTTLDHIHTDFTDTNYPETNPTTTSWDAYYVKKVTNTDGTIATEHAQFAPSITWATAVAGTNDAKPTIGISVGGNNSTTVTPNVATTDVYGITKLSNTAGADTTVAATPTGVQNAINNLTGNLNSTSPAASKTLTAFSQTNGIVSATFGDIAIANTQVSGLGTASTASTASSIAAGSTSTDLPTSAAVASFVEGKNYLTSFTETDPTVPSWIKELSAPTTAGTYNLKVTITNGTPSYTWEAVT